MCIIIHPLEDNIALFKFMQCQIMCLPSTEIHKMLAVQWDSNPPQTPEIFFFNLISKYIILYTVLYLQSHFHRCILLSNIYFVRFASVFKVFCLVGDKEAREEIKCSIKKVNVYVQQGLHSWLLHHLLCKGSLQVGFLETQHPYFNFFLFSVA